MLWKLLWFAIDSSVLLNEGVQFFFNDICHFLCIADCIKLNLYITAHLSMKMILVDSNLVRTIFGNNLFDPNYGVPPWKKLFSGAH